MKIVRLIGGSLESNGYVVYDREQGECFVIDPGYDGGRFLRIIEDLGLKMKGILLTHHHYDHVGGVEEIKAATGCPVYIPRADTAPYKKPVDVMLEDGDTLKLGDEVIKVLHTPGHTKGSVCFYSEQSKLAFTGDTVFYVEVGRVDLEGGSLDEMASSARRINKLWSDETVIYPGHGESCSMEYVRQNNPEFQYVLNL